MNKSGFSAGIPAMGPAPIFPPGRLAGTRFAAVTVWFLALALGFACATGPAHADELASLRNRQNLTPKSLLHSFSRFTFQLGRRRQDPETFLRRKVVKTAAAAAAPGCCSPPASVTNAVSSSPLHVRVSVQRHGQSLRFEVRNSELSEVTATFNLTLRNLKSNVAFPYTATFEPGNTLAFTLRPANPGAPWNYSYTNYYKLGSNIAAPDSHVYRFPYSPGSAYRVTQGFNGRFSHFGPEQYAIDWDLPEGTHVCAARGGLVVQVKDDSDVGGPERKYDAYDNYILIRHPDGTLGQYCHLEKNSARVAPGQKVRAGDWIARSGATGFATGPHLHFCVFKTIDGQHAQSIPVKFESAGGEAITPVAGRRYRAPGVDRARVPSHRPPRPASLLPGA